jgi:chaperonin GroES
MTTIEPLGARVLVRPFEEELQAASGLSLPETAREKPQKGRIEAVGDEGEMITDLEVGDIVLFAKYSGIGIQVDGVDHLLMEEGDVLARIHEK